MKDYCFFLNLFEGVLEEHHSCHTEYLLQTFSVDGQFSQAAYLEECFGTLCI